MTAHREHPEYPGLVAGCPECIAEARSFSWFSWDHAPLRRVTWRFGHPSGTTFTFVREVRVPVDASASDVDSWYTEESGRWLLAAIAAAVPGLAQDRVIGVAACSSLEEVAIGPEVCIDAFAPETLSLFEATP